LVPTVKNRNTIIGLIIVSIVAQAIILLFKRSRLDVAEMIGGTVALILLPYLLTLLIKLTLEAASEHFNDTSFFKTLIALWMIVYIFNVVFQGR
jgi:hypothetical protein